MIRAVGFVAAFGLALSLQRLAPHTRPAGSARVNGALWVLDAGVVGLVCGGCAFAAASWAERAHVGLLNLWALPRWSVLPITLVALDLVSYAWHRANHRVPLLWRLHRVHHSDPSFTVSTALRFHPGELLLALPVRLMAVVVLGAPVSAVLAFEVVFTFANLVEHGDIAVPRRIERRLSRLIVVPALHRRHHARRLPDRDSNFGTIFIVWDRLFGTCIDDDSESRVETGLPGIADVTLLGALTLPGHELPQSG
jgi:sterol desaturase/sphingolipid hydroxylase (fatty acid hydroxylase superfamily)